MGSVFKPIPKDKRLGSILSCIISGKKYNRDISMSLGIQPPSTIPHLRRLVKEGYVTIEDSPEGEGTKGKRYNKKIYVVNLDRIITDYFNRIKEQISEKEKVVKNIVDKKIVKDTFKVLRKNKYFRLLIQENLINSYELEIINKKIELSLNEMFDKINHYFSVEGVQNLLTKKIDYIIEKEIEDKVKKINKIKKPVKLFEEQSQLLIKKSRTQHEVLQTLVKTTPEIKQLYNLWEILRHLIRLDEPRGYSLMKVISSLLENNQVEKLINDEWKKWSSFEDKRSQDFKKMWNEKSFEKDLKKHIKEMGGEYKRIREEKRETLKKTKKIETLEEGVRNMLIPSICR